MANEPDERDQLDHRRRAARRALWFSVVVVVVVIAGVYMAGSRSSGDGAAGLGSWGFFALFGFVIGCRGIVIGARDSRSLGKQLRAYDDAHRLPEARLLR